VGKIFDFIVCLKQIFLGTTKFRDNAPRWLRACIAIQKRLRNAGL